MRENTATVSGTEKVLIESLDGCALLSICVKQPRQGDPRDVRSSTQPVIHYLEVYLFIYLFKYSCSFSLSDDDSALVELGPLNPTRTSQG